MSWLSSFIGDLTGRNATNSVVNAQTEANEQNVQLLRDMYEDGVARQQPFLDQQMSFLGISPGGEGNSRGYVGSNALSQFGGNQPPANTGPNYAQYVSDSPDLQAAFNRPEIQQRFGSPDKFGEFHYQQFGQGEGRDLPVFGSQPATPYAQPAPGGNTDMSGTNSAYQAALDSPFGQSMLHTTQADFDNIRGGMAAGGTALSGSHVKALDDRAKQNTNTAVSQYWNALNGGSVNAANVASQGNQFGAQVANQNSNTANALSSAYTNQGNQTAGLFGNALGGLAGVFF